MYLVALRAKAVSCARAVCITSLSFVNMHSNPLRSLATYADTCCIIPSTKHELSTDSLSNMPSSRTSLPDGKVFCPMSAKAKATVIELERHLC